MALSSITGWKDVPGAISEMQEIAALTNRNRVNMYNAITSKSMLFTGRRSRILGDCTIRGFLKFRII